MGSFISNHREKTPKVHKNGSNTITPHKRLAISDEKSKNVIKKKYASITTNSRAKAMI